MPWNNLLRRIDRTAFRLTPGRRLFEEGFGDHTLLDQVVGAITDVRTLQQTCPTAPITWDHGQRRRALTRERGSFWSPVADQLPPESRKVGLERLSYDGTPSPKVVVVLAATGDEGFLVRRLWSRGLVDAETDVVLVQHPLYGGRRPNGQVGPWIRTIAEQFLMNLAAVQEGRVVASELTRHYAQVVICGYSQGGMMAAFVAALAKRPIGVVPCSAANSAESLFVSHALSHRIDWKRLGAEAGSIDKAQRTLRKHLSPVRVDRFPPPLCPEAAILVSVIGDGFIPKAETVALHQHWPGSQLRWVGGNHLSGMALHRSTQHNAIRDAFKQLEKAT